MSAPLDPSRSWVRWFLVVVAAAVLWYLGHVLLESIWTLARLPPGSLLPRAADLALAPLCLLVAFGTFAAIRRRRDA
jgi:hypothetical protein